MDFQRARRMGVRFHRMPTGLVPEHKRSEKIQYMHHNPLRRGLVTGPAHWAWSSYLHYKSGERRIVETNPSGSPPEESVAPAKPISQKRDMGHPTLKSDRQMWATRHQDQIGTLQFRFNEQRGKCVSSACLGRNAPERGPSTRACDRILSVQVARLRPRTTNS
jgi:hypothetical protein